MTKKTINLNDSREIFDKLIYKNANIIMVVCGHTFLTDYIGVISRSNIKGDEVYIVTVNYQHYDNGGDGYVGVQEFMGNGQYNIKSYNTIERRYEPVDISFGRTKNN